MAIFPHALFWIDIETTGLQKPDRATRSISFEDAHILEVGVIITDFDLQPFGGYKEVVKLTPAAADALRKNEYVVKMHKANGLLKESAAGTKTIAEIEQEIIKLITDETTFGHGEFIIAGSGVAAYDLSLIQIDMPELAKYLVYYPFDIGVERRVSKILSGKEIINPVKASYVDGIKTHRAFDDVSAHLTEAGKYREFYRSVT